LPTIGQLYLPAGSVDGGGAGAAKQVDFLVLVIVGSFQQQRIELGLALDKRLGQRRPVIGRAGVVANQGNCSGMPPLTENAGKGATGMAGAENHDVGRVVHCCCPASHGLWSSAGAWPAAAMRVSSQSISIE